MESLRIFLESLAPAIHMPSIKALHKIPYIPSIVFITIVILPVLVLDLSLWSIIYSSNW